MNDIPLLKRQIETQLDEYQQAFADYAAFMKAWRERNPSRLPLYSDEARLAAE
jgi:hypothetical protein